MIQAARIIGTGLAIAFTILIMVVAILSFLDSVTYNFDSVSCACLEFKRSSGDIVYRLPSSGYCPVHGTTPKT